MFCGFQVANASHQDVVIRDGAKEHAAGVQAARYVAEKLQCGPLRGAAAGKGEKEEGREGKTVALPLVRHQGRGPPYLRLEQVMQRKLNADGIKPFHSIPGRRCG